MSKSNEPKLEFRRFEDRGFNPSLPPGQPLSRNRPTAERLTFSLTASRREATF